MNNQKNIEERLWEYIDGVAPPEERSMIDKLVETDITWKSKYRELLQISDLLKSTELEQPSMRFTRNVMEEIAKLQITPASKSYINTKIIWGLGLFFIAMVVGFLVYGFGQMEWTASSDNNIIADNLKRVDFSKFFNNTWINAFMMVNVVLGLFLLDSYLTNKRKEYRMGGGDA